MTDDRSAWRLVGEAFTFAVLGLAVGVVVAAFSYSANPVNPDHSTPRLDLVAEPPACVSSVGAPR